jgi:hypothetical protein
MRACTMTLSELRTLYTAMLEADAAYKKADPLDVHNAHAALKARRLAYNRAAEARRLAYNRAAGEYVAALIEESKPVAPIQIDRSKAE